VEPLSYDGQPLLLTVPEGIVVWQKRRPILGDQKRLIRIDQYKYVRVHFRPAQLFANREEA
jgi:hypothetical protein